MGLLLVILTLGALSGFAVGRWLALWLALVPVVISALVDVLWALGGIERGGSEPVAFTYIFAFYPWVIPAVAASIALGVWLRRLEKARNGRRFEIAATASVIAALVAVAVVSDRVAGDPEPRPGRPGTPFAKACANDGPLNFTHYWIGDEFEDLKVDDVTHDCGVKPGKNDVSYTYSSDPGCGNTAEGCYPELGITTRPMCEIRGSGAPTLLRDLRPQVGLRGVPAARENGEINLFTGDVVISVTPGPDSPPALAERAVAELRTGPPQLELRLLAGRYGYGIEPLEKALDEDNAQSGPGFVPAGGILPPPSPGALEGTIRC